MIFDICLGMLVFGLGGVFLCVMEKFYDSICSRFPRFKLIIDRLVGDDE